MQEKPELFDKNQFTFTFDEDHRAPTKIVVIGIGGAGGYAINRMVEAKINGVELVAANTDVQALRTSLAPIKLEIGIKLTKGWGCGGNPELGRQAALEETERILQLLEGHNMVFIIGGEGGGTFTGAAPIFASLASEIGALTMAIVTMPFSFQGMKRRTYAEIGVRELKEAADAMMIVPNEGLLRALDENVSLEDSLRFADDAVCQAVQGISEMLTKPGIINLELADVRTIIQNGGVVLMGTGIAEGSNRAPEAAQRAISSPLLEETPITGAKAALMNITASRCSLKLSEARSAAGIIKEKAGLEDMIIGAMYDDSMGERLKVTVIASGFSQDASQQSENFGKYIGRGVEVMSWKPMVQSQSPCSSNGESYLEELDRPAFKRRRAG